MALMEATRLGVILKEVTPIRSLPSGASPMWDLYRGIQ